MLAVQIGDEARVHTADRVWLGASEPWEWVLANAQLAAAACFGDAPPAALAAWTARPMGAAPVDVLVPADAGAGARASLAGAANALVSLGNDVRVRELPGIATPEDLADLHASVGDDGLWDWLTALPSVPVAEYDFGVAEAATPPRSRSTAWI